MSTTDHDYSRGDIDRILNERNSLRTENLELTQETIRLRALLDEAGEHVVDMSDGFRAIAESLRDHRPEIDPDKRTTPLGCAACEPWVRWPCREWTEASEALDEDPTP